MDVPPDLGDFEEVYSDEDDDDDDFYEPTPVGERSSSFRVLDPESLVQQQSDFIKSVNAILNISLSAAGLLSRHFNWSKEILLERYYDDPAKVLKEAGASMEEEEYTLGPSGEKEMCPICGEDFDGNHIIHISCGHYACEECWSGWVTAKLESGPSVIHSCCLMPKCPNVIPESLFKRVLPKDKYEVFSRYLLRSFVDDNPNVRWCPAPGCGRAIFCATAVSRKVVCSCGHEFCFQCSREPHQPAPCELLSDWEQKEKDDSGNSKWLVAYSKECPNCKRPINKDEGCNHMTCSVCGHEFCWICSGPWSEHGSHTGGYYSCNRFKKGDSSEVSDARADLERYAHYFERYNAHFMSDDTKKKLVSTVEDKKKDWLTMHPKLSWLDAGFFDDSVKELLNVRSVLRYTYVCAYYLPETPKANMFQYRQSQLEGACEQLADLLYNHGPEVIHKDKTVNLIKICDHHMANILQDRLHASDYDLSGLAEHVRRQLFRSSYA
eukprot:TRINITY_DN318_c0_g1_i2.p1 TRINITY_DN318_c0_g1~~TRINITY_DN318_c0_g1_i2.p1  ORF type:complete len:494 (-),score=90.89 TRINITY_DN318_c0_g1_i2:133-1614(-)